MEQMEDSPFFDLNRSQLHCDEPLLKQSVIHHSRIPSSSPLNAGDLANVEMTHLLHPETTINFNSGRATDAGNERLVCSTTDSVWKRMAKEELISKSVTELKKVRVDLSMVVEDVSSELVRLLEERQNLQDEVDIRNIAIEQLWKVQGKLQWRLTEPQLGIQMGVIFPSEDGETLDCL